MVCDATHLVSLVSVLLHGQCGDANKKNTLNTCWNGVINVVLCLSCRFGAIGRSGGAERRAHEERAS